MLGRGQRAKGRGQRAEESGGSFPAEGPARAPTREVWPRPGSLLSSHLCTVTELILL